MTDNWDNDNSLLRISRLEKHFPIQKGFFKKTVGFVKAVDGVSFAIREGETLGLVGESGCGKTTVLRTIIRALEPSGGDICYRKDGEWLNIGNMEKEALLGIRQAIRVVFQDPASSLNPRMTINNIISAPIKSFGLIKDKKKIEEAVRTLMTDVGLDPGYLRRYPHALSGGQQQRIGIARALATRPKLILADEPTSALDVSVQAQIINLFLKLQKDMRIAILFVTHDLSVVRHISDNIAVMYRGKIVEYARTDEIFSRYHHPYTEVLMSAIQEPDPDRRTIPVDFKEDVVRSEDAIRGCSFHPRCRFAKQICREKEPELADVDGHLSACFFPLSR